MNGKLAYYHKNDWENSNVIGDELIACSHGNPNTHKDTLLYKVNLKTKKRTPLLHDWCKANKTGLEDAYWLKVNGDIWMMAEAKKWKGNGNGEQNDIAVFKNWQFLYYIKPTSNHWESYSVSSPTIRVIDNMVLDVFYEGRYKSNINDYKTGLFTISLDSEKVEIRHNYPIMDDRLVPDDICFKKGKYRISGHRYEDGGWYAVVYKYINGEWKFDHNPKDQDGRVGEYYFNDYYWKSNKDGLWKFEKETPEPPVNEDDMSLTKIEEYTEEIEKYSRWIEIETNKIRQRLNQIDKYKREQDKFVRWIGIEIDKIKDEE